MQTLVDLFEVHSGAATYSASTGEVEISVVHDGRETLLDLGEIVWEETIQLGESLPSSRGARFWSSED